MKPGPAPMRELDPTDGVLLVDKPSGPTSHDIVDEIRRRFRIPKVGHGGTLDPLATGLLIILTGRGTKISESIMGFDKVYEGVMRLGIATDTEDADGQVMVQREYSGVTEAQVLAQMNQRVGDMLQTPPMVSAIKVAGVPLYKLARKGKVVERQPKLIHVYSFQLLAFTPPDVRFRLECTKGTYVRTLCADIGEALGCGAHLAELRRLKIGTLSVDQAINMEALRAMSLADLIPRLIPLAQFKMRDLSGP